MYIITYIDHVELGPFNTKQPTLIPMGVLPVEYTEVKIQSKQK